MNTTKQKVGVEVKVDGSQSYIEDLSLKGMQKVVEGYIEFVKLNGGLTMVVNEEGICQNLPQNFSASALAGKPIFGNVLIVRNEYLK